MPPPVSADWLAGSRRRWPPTIPDDSTWSWARSGWARPPSCTRRCAIVGDLPSPLRRRTQGSADHSPTLHAAQQAGFAQTLAKAIAELTDLSQTLARGKTRRSPAKATADIAAITADPWLRRVLHCELTGATPAAHRLTVTLDTAARDALETEIFDLAKWAAIAEGLVVPLLQPCDGGALGHRPLRGRDVASGDDHGRRPRAPTTDAFVVRPIRFPGAPSVSWPSTAPSATWPSPAPGNWPCPPP